MFKARVLGDFMSLADYDVKHRWNYHPPEEFPSPWASEWGFDEFGLWQSFVVRGEINGEPKQVTHKMRFIPKGSFLMGSPEGEPGRASDETQHEVELNQGFWLGGTTVTQDLWQIVMETNKSHFKQEGKEQLPAENVTISASKVFCSKLNNRLPGLRADLPTEAQWEYACRAGTTSPFSIVGSDGEQITLTEVNFDGNYPYAGRPEFSAVEEMEVMTQQFGEEIKWREKTVDVHLFPANAWGLKQMHGNVWEWCVDGIRPYKKESVTDPHGGIPKSSTGAAVRGGSCSSGARHCRSAARSTNLKEQEKYLGLRLACPDR